jgi:telomerase protein component 1
MVEKFPDFDAYQLGKYNKERNIKRKLKKARVAKEKAKSDEPSDKPNTKPMLTIKQMIRQLHISAPNHQVMCLLGKKYPLSIDEFRQSGLPGVYDPAKAGQRMKLPTPETWETFLSEKGNKASTWEELIEHKKLPFMAMLRNLRNLIYTGVNPRYHRWVMNKLTNERTVAGSRQFPFRFFSAYEVIPKDLEHFKELIRAANAGTEDDGKPKTEGAPELKRRKRKKPIVPAHMPPPNIFEDYRKALDTAVKLATTHNVAPIKGSTVVFCNVSKDSKKNCGSARGLGSSVRSIQDVGYLLGLMCKYVCEECDFRIFSSPSPNNPSTSHVAVDLVEGSILDNMKAVAEKSKYLGEDGDQFPFDYLEDLISSKRRVDNFLVLSHKPISIGGDDADANKLANLLNKYRSEVNPELLFVSVDLSGSGRANIGQDQAHPYDIQITGFSDQILRFIAERGDNNQLQYVEHIDEAKGVKDSEKKEESDDVSPWWRWLDSMGKDKEDPIHYPNHTVGGKWRDCRVFISSTFLDMHAERDLLTRIVFPELKERLKKRRVNLVEVDLRWGVTEEEAQHGKSMMLCLDEVERCSPFFVGLLGERYGWAPKKYDVSEDPRYDWVREYPAGRSITELEMHLAALSNPANATGSFFYLRDRNVLRNVPEEQRAFFMEKDPAQKQKLADLKQRIIESGLPVVQNYTARWRGIEEGKAMFDGLEEFGAQVFSDLWSAISAQYPDESVASSDLEHERSYHQAFVEERTRRFVGRVEQLDALHKFAGATHGKLAIISGTPGDGKSTLAAEFARQYAEKHPDTFVVAHFIGASPGSVDIRKTLFRVCQELAENFEIDEEVPDEFSDLVKAFPVFLEQASYKGKILVVLDAVNQLDDAINRAQSLDWLPQELPCKFVVSTLDGKCLDVLRNRKGFEIKLTPLGVPERTEIVRQSLAEYHKKLDERPMNNQMRVLLKKTDAHKPLYLSVACEELRVFGVYERVSDKIKELGPTVAKLLDGVLQRLEVDHGRDIVEGILSLIACSRGGMLERELLEVLELHGVGLTREKWLRLYRALGSFLKPSGEGEELTLSLFHEQLNVAVAKRYLKKGKTLAQTHRRLADYFYNRADPARNAGWDGRSDRRAFSELPYHLRNASMFDELSRVLSDLTFIEVKSSHNMTYDLVEDLVEACNAAESERYNGAASLREYLNFVKSSAHVLAENSALSFQQAANQPSSSAPAQKARTLWKDHNAISSPWVRWNNKPQQSDFCKMNFSGFSDAITAAAYSPDGTLLALAGKDCSVRLYNALTGAEIAVFTGHSNWVVACHFSFDGRQLVSGSWDGSLKIWDLYLLTETATLSGHARRVNDCCFSNDCRYILSASWDCTMMFDSIFNW